MTDKLHIIALTGQAGSGKDTAADMLVGACRFTKLAFADALRREVAAAFRLDVDNMQSLLSDRAAKETPTTRLALIECRDFGFIGAVALANRSTVTHEWATQGRTPRQILQWWGTEYRRAQRLDYWTSTLYSHLHQLHKLDGRTRFVITDCRFENEAALVRSLGGVVWQIERPGLPQVENGHASTADPIKLQPSAVIPNATSLNALREAVLGEWWAWEAQLESVKVEIAP